MKIDTGFHNYKTLFANNPEKLHFEYSATAPKSDKLIATIKTGCVISEYFCPYFVTSILIFTQNPAYNFAFNV